MNAQHTPGPWRTQPIMGTGRVQIVNDHAAVFGADQVFDIATLPVLSDGSHHANARLIAAAPELLAALQKAERYIDALSERVKWTQRDQKEFDSLGIRAAIAKATGGADHAHD